MNICYKANVISWALGFCATVLIIGVIGPAVAGAQVPWPTPPPGPSGFYPQVIPSSEVKPISAPKSPGSIAVQVDPIFAGPVPRIPPRPSTTIVTGEANTENRVTLHIDAGAIDKTLQLTYEPINVDMVPSPGSRHQIQRAFRIETYTHSGLITEEIFPYPIRLTLRIHDQNIATVGSDPSRILLARFNPQRNEWVHLVTTYQPKDSRILVRILRTGLFALIAHHSPVPR